MGDALTRQQVLELVFSKWEAQPQTEIVPLRKAGGRIAAREYLSQYNIPVVRASGMDGVAVKGSRFAGDMSGARHVEFIHRLEVYRSGEGYKLKPLGRGETDLPSIIRTNAMYISPIGEGRYQAGDVITVELLRDPSLLPVWEEQ